MRLDQRFIERLSESPVDFGLLFLRLGFGVMFLYHGLPQLMAGPEKWHDLGMAMAWLGVLAVPTFWGFMAGFSQALGALCLLTGLCVRPACGLMAFTMLMAAHWHFMKGDGLFGAAHAIEPGIVFIAFVIAGAGKYRLKVAAPALPAVFARALLVLLLAVLPGLLNAAPAAWGQGDLKQAIHSAGGIRNATSLKTGGIMGLYAVQGTVDEAEDEKVASALAAGQGSGLEEFAEANPKSRWAPGIWFRAGHKAETDGALSRALVDFGKCYSSLKGSTGRGETAMASNAGSWLAVLLARGGRKSELGKLIPELKKRSLSTGDRERLSVAVNAYTTMGYFPEHSGRCGAFAVGAINGLETASRASLMAVLRSRSKDDGMSLTEVRDVAQQAGLSLQAGWRTPTTKVIIPSIAQLKLGHYVALTAEKNGRFLLKDSYTPGQWITKQALDEEATGYFLYTGSSLPAGWRSVPDDEAAKVKAKGWIARVDPDGPDDCNTTLCIPCQFNCKSFGSVVTTTTSNGAGGAPSAPGLPQGEVMSFSPINPAAFLKNGGSSHSIALGMMVPNIAMDKISLTLMDTPLAYRQADGQDVEFRLTYTQSENTGENTTRPEPFGPNWHFNWASWVSAQASFNCDGSLEGYGDQDVYTRGGSMEAVGGSPNAFSFAQTTGSPNLSGNSYTRTLSDGSVETYGPAQATQPCNPNDNTLGPVYCPLAQVVDSHGRQITFQYQGLNLVGITDNDGRTTTLAYNNSEFPDHVTQITDPYGRQASFEYDPDYGYLTAVTDPVGIRSSITYADDGVPATLTTPYGTTVFGHGDYPTPSNAVPPYRWVQITDPLGKVYRAELMQSTTIPSSDAQFPQGMDSSINIYMNYRDTYYWDPQAMAYYNGANKYNYARVYHWFHSPNLADALSSFLAAYDEPGKNRIWFAYPNTNYIYATLSTPYRPSQIGRVTESGATELWSYQYNSSGFLTQATDPLGRSLQYQYAANGYDLQTVQRLRSGTWSTLAQYGYDANDYVNSYSGADGQTWNYTYNNGKLAQVTQPTGEVTTMSYGSDGFLSRVQPPNSASWTQYTWQNGMIQTASTASVGPLTFAWDGLHRLTGVTYPDGTSETRAYDRLDLGSYEDRKGRTTQYSHDADRRVQWVKRPDGKQVTFTWCDCGSLGSIQDSMGRVTTWTRDILGRVTAKTYPDGSTVSYTYDTGRGLLQSALDAKGQRKSYAYGLDGALATVQHTGSQIPTADVALTYDPWDGRLTQMTDGIGATQYSYYTEGSQGGGRVKTVAGPYSGEQVAYVYDGSSRLASRSVDGGTESFTYAQDLLTSIQNPLGNFTYQYSASTGQLSNVNMPNGVATTYSYYPALQDGRLSSINNALGSTTLSNFGYNYDAVGNITNWTIQQGSSSQIWDLTSPQSYDSLDQLSAAVLKDAQGDSTNYDWNYDAAGNRTLEQIGPDHTTAVANNLNQITSLDSSMPVTFTGTTSIPALVTVNGASANTITAKYFGTAVRLNDGGNTVTVQAVSASGVSKTAGYYVNTKKMLKYDANGNMITDGVWDYAWDSEDRLVGIKPANALVPGTALKTWEFGYDGFGRRVRMVTRQGVGEAVETHFVWAGSKIVEARDGQNNLLKRYFSQGMQIASGDKAGLYYYTKDHLGSIREVLDSTGAVRAQYSYDLWGRQTKLAGDVEADFGYAGYYELAGTRLKLTWFRGYNADLGRWLSRDPIGLLGGLNDAHFVLGNPVKYFDLWGLDEAGGQTQAQSVVGTLWDEVVSYVSGAIQKWKNSPVAVVTEKTAGGDATGVASTCAAGVEAGGAAIKAAQVITNSQSQQYDQLKQMGIVGENDAGADEVAARQNVINHVTPTPDQN